MVDAPDRALDLGSGGGVPGLILALEWPDSRWTLLDTALRRTRFLQEAVEELGLRHRVQVVAGRAEEVGRTAGHRGAYDLVTARSFAGPAITAECGRPFLRVGGALVVSEPPVPDEDRWPLDGLSVLGLDLVSAGGVPRLAVLRAVAACPERYPRRTGIPGKRPLW